MRLRGVQLQVPRGRASEAPPEAARAAAGERGDLPPEAILGPSRRKLGPLVLFLAYVVN